MRREVRGEQNREMKQMQIRRIQQRGFNPSANEFEVCDSESVLANKRLNLKVYTWRGGWGINIMRNSTQS